MCFYLDSCSHRDVMVGTFFPVRKSKTKCQTGLETLYWKGITWHCHESRYEMMAVSVNYLLWKTSEEWKQTAGQDFFSGSNPGTGFIFFLWRSMLLTEAEKMYKVWNKTSMGVWLYNKIPEIILLCEASTDSFFFYLLSQRCCLSLFSACTLVYWCVFDNITLENVPNYSVLTLLLDWNLSA